MLIKSKRYVKQYSTMHFVRNPVFLIEQINMEDRQLICLVWFLAATLQIQTLVGRAHAV